MSESNFPFYVRGQARVELGRKWGKASAAKRKPSDLDWDTIRLRSAHDAKGQVLREGVTYNATGETKWAITRSSHGRINQLDVLVNGAVWATGGTRKLRTMGIPI